MGESVFIILLVPGHLLESNFGPEATEIAHNMMKYVETFSKQTWKHLFEGDFRFELLSLNLTALSFRIGKRHLEFENVTCVSFFISLQNKILIRFSV